MVAPITSATKIRVYLDFDAAAAGGGTSMLGGLFANDPAQGQGASPIAAGCLLIPRWLPTGCDST